MTPADARALRRRRVAELRAAEPDLSLRQMATRLELSRDTVSRDLDTIDRLAAEPAPPVAESATGGGDGPGPAADTAPQAGEGVAAGASQSATAAGLPLRVAQPLAGIDLSQWPALRRDLADLVRSGRSAESVVHMAVVSVAHAYRQALATGDLIPGQRFHVTGMELCPLPTPAPRATPADEVRPVPPGEAG